MFTTLRRPYKERTPDATVAFIEGILQRHDLNPIVTFEANPFPEVYSVSLELPAAGFRTNGKGRTPEYCLASAYAEFMERMQNGLHFSMSRVLQSEIQREFGFYYAPDEGCLTRQQFEALPQAVLEDLVRYGGAGRQTFMEGYFDRIEKRGASGAVAVPFFSTAEGRNIFLPLNLLLLSVGSNGMAAGNSLEEAFFQALCELLERWGAAAVFYQRLTPPSVPDEYLRQFEQEYFVMQAIQATGKYRVTVKDFSAGLGIPAVGVIIENTVEHTYRLNVGSDTCFQVALSRSLTEVFQGFSDQKMIDQRLLPIPNEDPPCFGQDDDASRCAQYAIFSQFTKDNSGAFPVSLFGTTPSYDFDPATFTPRLDYGEEVQQLIAFFHRKGHDVYLRDVSYLGFPSVFVYVPEISALGRKNTASPSSNGQSLSLVEWDKVEERMCRLKTLTDDELVDVATRVASLPPYLSLTQLLNLKLKTGSPWSQMPVCFLLTQMWYKAGRFDDALKAFRIFRKSREDDVPYYDALEKYLALRSEGESASGARARLETSTIPVDAVRQVCDDMENPSDVLSHVLLPKCPDCQDCEMRPECLTTSQIAVARTLYPIMQRQMPAQGAHLIESGVA